MIHVGNAPIRGALRAHAQRWHALHLRDVIDRNPVERAAMALDAAGLRLDYSRQRLDVRVLSDLATLARQCGIEQARDAMLDGQVINVSEGRAALHTALRAPQPLAVVADEVLAERARLQAFVDAVHNGAYVNANGETYTDVINIGVGGSDLGPRLICRALASQRQGLRAHFVGNLDSAALQECLAAINPTRCLCVVVSKSFGTQETRLTAEQVRHWLAEQGGDVARQFIAVTAAPDKAQEFGLDRARCFTMWPWVGGRFSVWSSAGLSVALSLGWPAFAELLAGAHDIDEHFATAPLESNLPVVWALLALWNRNFLTYDTLLTTVYSEQLGFLPEWLQQLDMESNGKSVDRDGRAFSHVSAPVQWGGVGTNAQHAFFQLLHQGQDGHPIDFVLPLSAPGCDPAVQRKLLGNALAQAAALSHGLVDSDMPGAPDDHAAWRRCPGNRPSSLMWMETLSPRVLGALLAAYEHRCFVLGWLWGVNSFDQFGVELGKNLAERIEAGLDGDAQAWPDPLLEQQAQRLHNIGR